MDIEEFLKLEAPRAAFGEAQPSPIKPTEAGVSPVSHFTAKDLFQQLKLDDVPDSTGDLQNIINTSFPRNTPAMIVGTKGSGKTYLLASIFQYAYNNNQFKRIFYIYGQNVDTTLSRALPATVLINVPHDGAEAFLTAYLRKKTKYCSCKRFVTSDGTYEDHVLERLFKQPKHHIDDPVDRLRYCEKVCDKYEQTGLRISLGQGASAEDIDVGTFSQNDYDAFIVDDIGQFPDLFTNNRRSKLYQYFTITRQNQTTFYLAGQEFMQLSKAFRSQLGAVIVLKGVDPIDVLNKVAITKAKLLEIYNKWPSLKKHEGVVYNVNDQEYEFIKV